ncbi:hypothetical protein ACPCSP_25220 [Streptomyces cinereoruber]|uniref:hypothetical protein n=1 Tax=Streptomyces cinereoruber TaxID=67260 RepID=UPI003C2B1AB9
MNLPTAHHPDRDWATGHCWCCAAENVPVLWIGPAQSQDHGTAPVYACAACVLRWEQLIAEHGARRDAPGREAHCA